MKTVGTAASAIQKSVSFRKETELDINPPLTLSDWGTSIYRSMFRAMPQKSRAKPGTQILLCQLIGLLDENRELTLALELEGLVVDGKVNPAATLRNANLRLITSLATKLNVTPSSIPSESPAARDEENRVDDPDPLQFTGRVLDWRQDA